MAAKKARKTVGTWVLYFALVICIFGIKKRTFVSNDIIGLYFNLDADICKERFVFSSLYAVNYREKISTSTPSEKSYNVVAFTQWRCGDLPWAF